MKKGTIIALIVAIALIVTGGMILMLGLSFAGDTRQEENGVIGQEVIVKQSFDHITVDTDTCDVSFAMFSGREDCMVKLQTHARIKHTVAVEDGTLRIQMLDERRWTDHINVFGSTENMQITVYLPAAEYGALRVTTDTGDIIVPGEFTFTDAELFSDTGEIRLEAVVTDRITANTDTGDIHVLGSSPAALNVSSNTGDLELTNMDCGYCTVKTDTGEIDLKNFTCQSLDCTSDTGETELEQVTAMEYLKIISNTGDVELMECDGETITVQTNTGDISGVLLSPKEFFAQTDTGTERIADHSAAVTGQCYITSHTGDITFGYTK